MLVGYVSDENYLAICGVDVELARDGETIATTRSTARGAIVADVTPGTYRVFLAKDGFGPKWVDVAVGESGAAPVQFRLLADQLLGYAWPKWVQGGDQTTIRVHSPEPYKAELWRYGLNKERVGLLGWFDEHGPRAMAQILPEGDFTIGGTDWNHHGFTTGPAFVFRFTAPERSGLYYVHLTGESGVFFSFPLVVAPPRPMAKIAVIAGTNTWNAYNNFGGRSNYINAEGLPSLPTVNARLDLRRYRLGTAASQSAANEEYPPLSFDRPDIACHVPLAVEVGDPMAGRLASTLAPGTWRLLGWLEREGFACDLYSDHQLDSGIVDLDAYEALILDVHPEYWSRGSYFRVRDWVRDRGGKLLYLGGNGIDCEVEFVGDLATRHLTQQPKRDTPEEAHLENRFHRTCEPTAGLLGVAFDHRGEGTAAPYEVLQEDHWIFAGTGLAKGDRIGESTLHERVPGGASGHETDKVTPNAPPQTVVLARGLNRDGGGAELVYYEAEQGGGAVFSVGSITYISALLVDEKVSAVTSNVLRAFTNSGKEGPDMQSQVVVAEAGGSAR